LSFPAAWTSRRLHLSIHIHGSEDWDLKQQQKLTQIKILYVNIRCFGSTFVLNPDPDWQCESGSRSHGTKKLILILRFTIMLS
jgi:hypothetical protein